MPEFVAGVTPPRPGAYFDFIAQEQPPSLGNALGTVAVPIVHSWGPDKTVVSCASFGDFLSKFGQGSNTNAPPFTAGYGAVFQAFQGEGIPGSGGAGRVLVYRMVGSAGAKSSHALQNATVPAITITAIHSGSFGDNISLGVVANTKDPTNKNDLLVYVQGVLQERWTHAKTDITALAAAINATLGGSRWVTAGSVTTGVALATVSTPVALSGGNDGSTVVAQDWTDMMTAYSTERYGIFAPYNLTDDSIMASLVAWQAQGNQAGRRFITVTGGGDADSATTAAARATAANDPNVITLGIGTYSDINLGDLNTATLAPRVAGILAARTEAQSLTFARLAGLTITTGASDSDLLAALTSGFIAITRDSNVLSPTRLDKAVTTYTSTGNPAMPFSIYSVPKFIRSMQSLEMEIVQFAEANIIGRLPVNDSTRDYLIGNTKARMKSRETNGIIQNGWTVGINQNPPPDPTDNFISIVYSLAFTRGLEQTQNIVTVQ